MGLDWYDIHLGLEKTFDVSLSDDDFQDVFRDRDIRVGDLYEVLLKKLEINEVVRYDVSVNFILWRRMQADLHQVTGLPLDDIKLQTPLVDLFPKQDRCEMWEELRAASPYHLRDLDYPRVVRVVGFTIAVLVVLAEQLQIWQLGLLQWMLPLLGLFGIWMVAETYLKILFFLRRWRTSFPKGTDTVKDLCRDVLANNYDAICEGAQIPLDEGAAVVWRKLTDILVDTLGVERDAITFRTRLVRDLGME
jgi:acyl carrier protein